MSITILFLGSTGYIGKALYKELSKNFNYLVTGIGRKEYEESNFSAKRYDYVINCAMPSARFKAENDVVKDYLETLDKTAQFYYRLNYNKFIQISSISARSENNVYGRHKLAAESIIDQSKHLIFRLTATYDDSLKKGVVYDLINNNPIYVSNKSSYSFASLDYVVKYISGNLSKTNIVECGAGYAISLEEICDKLQVCRKFSSDYIDEQEVKNNDLLAPSPYLVADYIEQRISKLVNKEFYAEAERK